MNSFYLENVRLRGEAATVTVEDGVIAALGAGNDKGLPRVDGEGKRLLPGFLDLHTHGAAGVDVNAADPEGLRKISRFFASHGVTGWQCSVLTDTKEQTLKAIRAAREVIEKGSGGAQLMGIHLEGPCLSVEYKGAMPESLLMKEARIDLFREYQEAAGGHVTYLTLSPEVPGAVEIIPALGELGITVAMGHSAAGYDTSWAAVKAGVTAATHLGNAQRLFHQHDPAIWGVALESDCWVEAICDGLHLHPGTVRLYLKAKGWDRVVAITDSIMAAGLPDGDYKLGVNDVIVKDGDAKLKSGVRAGSTLTLDRALGNIVRWTGASPEDAAQLMSRNPAELMGWSRKGAIAPGKDADLVLVDEGLGVFATFVRGERVFG